jgi:hypothetical protein
MPDAAPGSDRWLRTLRSYLAVSAVGHLFWETLHLPLYTLWATGTPREIAFAVSHCTGGDVMIAALSLVAALALFGSTRWPLASNGRVVAAMTAIGVAYTIYSEWLNMTKRVSWAYSGLMPVVPVIGTGLSPLLQWLVIPLIAMRIATGAWPWRAE